VATLNLQIATGNDDANESPAGTVNLSHATTILMDALAGYWAALRFTNVTIPPGSTVTAATLTITTYTSTHDSIDLDIYAEDVDNSAALAATANNISGRTLTTAKVTWTAANVGSGAKSPGDLSPVVQEVFDRVGWASGNALTLILDARSTSNDLYFRPYENGAGEAAALSITYTPPAGGGLPVKAMYYAGARR
jgi:hypothetical protein